MALLHIIAILVTLSSYAHANSTQTLRTWPPAVGQTEGSLLSTIVSRTPEGDYSIKVSAIDPQGLRHLIITHNSRTVGWCEPIVEIPAVISCQLTLLLKEMRQGRLTNYVAVNVYDRAGTRWFELIYLFR